MMSLICEQNQFPESSENSQSTLEKGGRNPCVVELDDILEDLLKYFNELEILCKTEKEIEYICEIVKEHDDCWSEDDIKQAWGKRKIIDGDKRRARWAVVIVMQILKRQRTNEEESDLMLSLIRLFFTPDQKKAERENAGGGEDVFWSNVDINQARGKAESMKVVSEDRSTQSSDELKTLGAAGGDEQMSGGNHPTFSYHWQTQYLSHFWTGRPDQCQVRSQDTVNSAPEAHRTLESEENMYNGDESFYIRIPRLEMFHNEPTARDDLVPHVRSRYKLMNGFPSDNTVNITRSYAMSFDNYTRNAEWVYEILNRETTSNNCEEISFGGDYVKGHLAPAANHRWCRQAYNDTYLFSNLIPQHHLLNIRTWKALENYCRSLFRDNKIRNVHVYTGPLYDRHLPQVRFKGKRAPTHLFKVIIVENENGTVREPECYVMPNEEPKNTHFTVNKIQDIYTFQTYTGLTFVERRPNVGDTDRIKTVRLQGEDLNQTRHYVNIKVRITHNVNW